MLTCRLWKQRCATLQHKCCLITCHYQLRNRADRISDRDRKSNARELGRRKKRGRAREKGGECYKSYSKVNMWCRWLVKRSWSRYKASRAYRLTLRWHRNSGIPPLLQSTTTLNITQFFHRFFFSLESVYTAHWNALITARERSKMFL